MKTIDRAELDDYQAQYEVISTRLFAGKTVIHVLADSEPGDGFDPVEGGLEDVYFSTLCRARAARPEASRPCSSSIAGFEFRYQLRNPVFWVAVAIFFLMGFGDHRERERQHRHRRRVHENAPYAIAVATADLRRSSIMFVIDRLRRQRDRPRRRDRLRADRPLDPGHASQIVIGRFLGGFTVAALGYLAVPLGMCLGSLMPWVDPETVGPQQLAYLRLELPVFAFPNIFLTARVLFALATVTALDDGHLYRRGRAGDGLLVSGSDRRPEDRISRHLRALGAARDGARCARRRRYWTQAEMNSRLVDLSRLLLFNRIFCVLLGFAFLGFTLWRFTMTERAPSQVAAAQAREARSARGARSQRCADALGGAPSSRAMPAPIALAQFLTRASSRGAPGRSPVPASSS